MRIRNLMKSTLVVGTTALDVANNLGGVPFAGAAATLLGELGRSCEQVKIHKSACRRLILHAQAILDGLQDNSSGLEGTRLQEAADELEMILEQVKVRMNKWITYNTVRAWWMQDDIAKGIGTAEQKLEAHVDKFHIRAYLATHEKLHEVENNRQRDQAEIRDVLDEVLANQRNQRRLLEMHLAGEPVAKDAMRAAQTEFHAQPRGSSRYIDYERNVYNLYHSTGVMPTLPDLNHEVKVTEGPVAGGTYSDVYLGVWSGNVQVALKSLRGVGVSRGAQKRFEHEIEVWHALDNPYILQFLGIVSNLGPHIHVVSPWQSNGNALEYVKSRPWVNRLELLTGAARGVEYLHGLDKPVVHGNLKCANILVSDKGKAVISDFGLSRIIEDITETSASATLTNGVSSRWCAPEIMDGSSSPTLATDVYSFSMAILECLTTTKPFAHVKREMTVVIGVVDGKRPPRPAGTTWDRWFTEELWELMDRCWSHESPSRPYMTEVAATLQNLGLEQQVTHQHLASSVFV